jgi:hypothetical protein
VNHTTSESVAGGTVPISIGKFQVRADPRPAQPPPPQDGARPALRLVSSAANPRPAEPQSGPTDQPWRYWVSVTFADGLTGANLELSRTAPIITSDDRRVVADGIAAHNQRPVASVDFITSISRPNSATGQPEPDLPPNVRISPADDSQPWHYRVNYATDTGRGSCEVDRTGPIRGRDDVASIQAAIASHNGRTVVAIESFSVLGAPAQTTPRSI